MADEIEKLHLIVVDPDKVVYEGDVKRVFVPGRVAELAILPQHTPLYSELVAGVIKIETIQGKTEEIKIDGGVTKVQNNELHILIGY